MATLAQRPRVPVSDLPSDFPNVPALQNEASLDAPRAAASFVQSLDQAVTNGDWDAFGDLFAEQCWWRDNLTLTYDKRTLRGKPAILAAWKALAPRRRPSRFAVAPPGTAMVEIPAAFTRLAPTLATLDVPFTFSLAAPEAGCVGIAKLIPSDDSATTWKIWTITTALHSVKGRPFEPLPRKRNSLINPSQRGIATPQGLPRVDGILDALVVGGGCAGLAVTIHLESTGANVAVFEAGRVPAWVWDQRYEAVRLHHPNFMIQLPRFPVPDNIPSQYLCGKELVQYMSQAVQDLQLPFFAGVNVKRNEFDEAAKLWNVTLEDVASGQMAVVQARNLVLGNGWLVPENKPLMPKLANREAFSGIVEHAVEYNNPATYAGKNVVIVGIGNTAHDIAKDLADNTAVKSITLLQRSPTVLFDFPRFDAFAAALYRGNIPVETADFLAWSLPTGILRDMARGALAQLVQAHEPLYQQLEAKGYVIDRHPDVVARALDERGRSFFFDAPGAFDLVLCDRIRIAQGEAKGFTANGLVVSDKDGGESVMPAEGVILATGYGKTDVQEHYAATGFLDEKSAAKLVDFGNVGVDAEGEQVGQTTKSGRKLMLIHSLGRR